MIEIAVQSTKFETTRPSPSQRRGPQVLKIRTIPTLTPRWRADREGFGKSLGLRIDAPRPDRGEVAGIGLGLRADKWVTAHLARRGE